MGLLAGANALIVGNYLTTIGRAPEEDHALLEALGMPVAEGPGEGRFIVDATGAHAAAGPPVDPAHCRRLTGVRTVRPSGRRRDSRCSREERRPSDGRRCGVTDARSRCMRHVARSSTPSAQHTAALIGDTWLTATTSVVAEVRRAQKSTTRSCTVRGDSPPGGANVGSRAPPLPLLGRDLARARARPIRRSRSRRAVRRPRPRAPWRARDRAPRCRARALQRARDTRARPVRARTRRRAARPAACPRSFSATSTRPCSRPARLPRSGRAARVRSPSAPSFAHDREPAGAHERGPPRRVGEPEAHPDPPPAARPSSSSTTRSGSGGSSGASGESEPNAGHQNTSLCVHAPPSTSPANHPIARLSARRRRSR